MKRHFKILTLLICIFLILSACSKKPASTDSAQTQTNKVSDTSAADTEKNASGQASNSRPIAVMIDNDNDDARPQAGLDEAYLVYEMVVEGGATRYMALFKDSEIDKIGPVRSSRHYFLDYLMENDAIYVHYGWSPSAQADIASFKINKINGVNADDDGIFWRDRTYTKAWHSAYTSTKNILEKAAEKGYSATTEHKNAISCADENIFPESGNDALNVTLRYSDMYRTGYVYNEETGLYEKTVNGKDYTMQNGNSVAVKNIIVHLATDVPLGDGSDRRDVKTTGTGKGYYITNGKCEEITWSKPSRKENTVYTKSDGTPLMINPGKTFVNVISPSATITIE